MMRSPRLILLGMLLPLLASAAVAESLNGTVTNATTGRPAAGTVVTLVDPMGGMAEIATTKADAQGRFSFNAPPAQGPRLARAEQGGVNYFKMVTPGSTSVDLEVYDAATSVEGISGSADVLRMQAQGGTLQAIELFAIRNDSKPPRTLAAPATFEFVLPDGAEIDGASAQAPNGQPISAKTNPAKEKNHYAFGFALKPGETRLQLTYHMPYSGQASFTPRLTRNFEHYVLVMPASMSFSAHDAKQFQAMTNQPGSNVQVSLHTQTGQDLGYAISGTGAFPEETAQGETGGGGQGGGGGPMAPDAGDNRPGGGLGRPIDAPDGLAKYRWYILGVLLTVLIGGGIWTHERTRLEAAEAPPAADFAPVAAEPPELRAPVRPSSSAPARTPVQTPAQPPAAGSLLLTALKEELFALEIDRQQGRIAPEEYTKVRAALEQTLQRALTRAQS
jgi:hypothetical protein